MQSAGSKIALTRGFVTIVDDEDFESLSLSHWITVHARGGKKYAGRFHKFKGRTDCTLLHRLLAAPQRGQQVDHINGDTLDNRRANLRLCSPSENLGNQMLSRASTSGFKGVHWDRCHERWIATVCKKRVGYFRDPESAARAYDEDARQRWGEFARLNFPRPGEQCCRPETNRTERFFKGHPCDIPVAP